MLLRQLMFHHQFIVMLLLEELLQLQLQTLMVQLQRELIKLQFRYPLEEVLQQVVDIEYIPLLLVAHLD